MIKMINLANTEDEDEETSMFPTPMYPCGLAICLDSDVLKKLGLGLDDFKVGSTIHVTGMAAVTSASERQNQDGGSDCRVELQFQFIGVENENEETDDDGEDEKDEKSRRKPDFSKFYSSDY